MIRKNKNQKNKTNKKKQQRYIVFSGGKFSGGYKQSDKRHIKSMKWKHKYGFIPTV
jgi:hypothetical protein